MDKIDSWTESDIDRTYIRLKEQIDLSKVKNKSGFKKAVQENPKTKKWNKNINDFFWDMHSFKDKIEKKERVLIKYHESDRQKAYSRGKSQKWTNYELKYLQRLKTDGLSVSQISNQLFRTKSSIYTKSSRINKK